MSESEYLMCIYGAHMSGCQLDIVKKIGFLKRFDFQKERFLMPEKRFFYCMHTYIRTVRDSIKK